MTMMRLQKFIAAAGVCSRRRAETLIREGRVKVNGRLVDQMGVQVNSEADVVEVLGRVVAPAVPEVNIMLNKPAGYISSCRHSGRKIVLDLVDTGHRVYPAGRLDRDSTGLLLLTNNGRLHFRLTHPSFDHEKEYRVKTRSPVTDEALKALASGVALEGRPTRPAQIQREAEDEFTIVLKEGRNRQIRRMVEAVGGEVAALHRVRMATLVLGGLASGQWRHLTGNETAELKRFCGL